jgi:hypothetical protein
MTYHNYNYRSNPTPKHYHELFDVVKAREISDSFNGSVSKNGDKIEVVQNRVGCRYSPDGTIEIRWNSNSSIESGRRNFVESSALPPGIQAFSFSNPEKHYIAVTFKGLFL